MEKPRGIRLDIEHQAIENDEADDRGSAERVVRDMLASWRNRLGGQTTMSRAYPLNEAAELELTSDHDNHIIAHHTSQDFKTTYEYDGARRHLTVDISPLGDIDPIEEKDPARLLESLGRLLFEADVQERERLSGEQ